LGEQSSSPDRPPKREERRAHTGLKNVGEDQGAARVSNVVDHILSAPSGVVYALVGLLVFAEDALFIGFVLPGETAAIVGGVAASQHHVHLSVILAIVVAAAIVGDSVGYEIGRHFGARILNIRALRRHQRRLSDAQSLLARRGGWAVFFGRFTAFFRAVMPALAGTARMPYPRFLAFNAAGGVIWGTGAVLIGYLAGNSYQTVEKTVGRDVAVVVAVIALSALVIWRVRHHRAEVAREKLSDETADS
jgi:membrane-associated protein